MVKRLALVAAAVRLLLFLGFLHNAKSLSLEEETCQSPARLQKPQRVHQRALFTDAAIEDLADVVKEKIFIPLVPTPIVIFCLNVALDKMNTGLSPELSYRIEEMLLAETTDSSTDDFSDEELTELAKMTASEVNPQIPVLILRESTRCVLRCAMIVYCEYLTHAASSSLSTLSSSLYRELVLQKIFKIVFSIIVKSSKERRLALFASAKDIALDLFQPASRQKLVQRLNQLIDVPVLNESQESKLLSVGIDYCASTLEKLLPKPLVQSLRSENATSMDEFKKYLVAEGECGLYLPAGILC